MPKSRHSHRKKLQHFKKEKAIVAARPQQKVAAAPTVAQPARPVSQPRVATATAGATARAVAESHPYITRELKRIGILAVIMIVILVILRFVLP